MISSRSHRSLSESAHRIPGAVETFTVRAAHDHPRAPLADPTVGEPSGAADSRDISLAESRPRAHFDPDERLCKRCRRPSLTLNGDGRCEFCAAEQDVDGGLAW